MMINGTERDIAPKANLRGANLRGADLSGANLSYADLCGADLRGADLRGADLSYANLSYTNLRGADLSHATLRGANLRDADLRDANLRRARGVLSCGSPYSWPVVAVGTKDGLRIAAGCRWFTWKQAQAHWKARGKERSLMIPLLAYIKAAAKLSKWKLT